MQSTGGNATLIYLLGQGVTTPKTAFRYRISRPHRDFETLARSRNLVLEAHSQPPLVQAQRGVRMDRLGHCLADHGEQPEGGRYRRECERGEL